MRLESSISLSTARIRLTLQKKRLSSRSLVTDAMEAAQQKLTSTSPLKTELATGTHRLTGPTTPFLKLAKMSTSSQDGT
jgi:hypothetical protein